MAKAVFRLQVKLALQASSDFMPSTSSASASSHAISMRTRSALAPIFSARFSRHAHTDGLT